MKALFTLLLIFVWIAAYSSKQYSIHEIKSNTDFDISVTANGEYSGKSIELQIKSNHKKDVEIIIPAGTVFYTDETEEQILIIVEEQVLAVNKGQKIKRVLDGFCTEARDGVPSAGNGMSFMATKRDKLQRLADFINENKIDKHAVQEAVWCVSDNHSISNVYLENEANEKELINLLSELTGQSPTWHKVRRKHRMEGRHIVASPVLVTGEVVFSTSKATVVSSKIVDDSGELVYENPNKMNLPKVDDVHMDFNLSVSGWVSGKYYVVYYDADNTTILKKEFEI